MNFGDSLHDMLELVMAIAYAALATNLVLVIACFPLVVGLITTDPAQSWPFLVLTVPLCAPALVAASAVFDNFSKDISTSIVRTFWHAWRVAFPRALAVGALATALSVVAGVDAVAAWGHPIGAFAIPVLVMLIVLAVCVMLTSLVALGSVPRARVRDVLRVAAFASVRRWYLTVVSLIVLGLLWGLFVTHPALALGLALSPLLYAVWANSRYALRPALEAEDALEPDSSHAYQARA